MPSSFAIRSLGRAAERVPGLRRVPIVRLLSAAEVAVLAREHVLKLTPDERRRLAHLVRVGRGGKSRLSTDERRDLEALVTKLEPRDLMAEAAGKLSPVPLPKRLVRGRDGS